VLRPERAVFVRRERVWGGGVGSEGDGEAVVGRGFVGMMDGYDDACCMMIFFELLFFSAVLTVFTDVCNAILYRKMTILV